MRKIVSLAVAGVLAFSLTGCAGSLKYDSKNWFDDSANLITLDLTNVNVQKGLGGDAKSQLDKLSEFKTKDYVIVGTSGGILDGTQVIFDKDASVTMATVPNVLDYTSNANNLLFIDCKFMPYFFNPKGSVMSLLKDSVKDSIDFSFKLYNRVVLIDNDENESGDYAKIYIVSFSQDSRIESLGVAYVNSKYKEGKSFATYLNDAKNNKSGLTYTSGYINLQYIEKPEYMKEDLVRQMLKANLKKGQPYSFALEGKTQEYSFYKINHNSVNRTCTQNRV